MASAKAEARVAAKSAAKAAAKAEARVAAKAETTASPIVPVMFAATEDTSAEGARRVGCD